MIKQIIREKLVTFKQEIKEIKGNIQEKTTEITRSELRSYSEAVKDKKKECILIVKPKMEQESEVIKKLVKEKVDINNLIVGVTKIKRGGKRSIILGCDSEREIKILESNAKKLNEDFDTAEPKKRKSKIKIINISEEVMKMKDDNNS